MQLKSLFFRLLLCVVFVNVTVLPVSALDLLKEIELEDTVCVDISKNHLVCPSDTNPNMSRFYQQLDSLVVGKEGRLNILHIGGSHIQADIFSNRIRRNMDSLNQGMRSPRGLIFPYSAAKTNNPLNYKVKYDGKWEACKNVNRELSMFLGMTGIAIQTADTAASIKIVLNPNDSTRRWVTNKIQVLGYSDYMDKVEPVLLRADSSVMAGVHEILTDSYIFEIEEEVDSFVIKFEQKDTVPHSFTLTGIITDNDNPGIVYHSIGVNGASVPSYLKCRNFERDLHLIKPDLVIFGIGINDATPYNFNDTTFMKNYDLLIQDIKRVSPECALIFVSNNDSYRRRKKRYTVNTNGEIAQKAFYSLAKKHNACVWDLFDIMGGLKSMAAWERAGLAKRDKVHFTVKGYTLIGDLLYNAIISDYLQQKH